MEALPVSSAGLNPHHYIGAGVPTVVAKRMMQGGGQSALVGRIVTTAEAAATAAADGANLILVTVSVCILCDRVNGR